ncbi:phosphoribosylglycinamide formyltransferase [Alteribacter natronophilus]|uniref:phosphoribosylglycinamide formyltransferase n=1 Tax=Alteribacter natronophilus TaxID=2583810 RepID=UPI00110DD439|nr:phosphoribosylglycinamide formyltransferase [Alteribacter natronophilus]TMW71106.1 phosphoribosylglycinamide formyltransferase [Alteribacter natronophilus]
MSVKLAVFASGTGSNFDAIVAAVRDGRIDGEVVLLVSDKPGSKAVEKARDYGIDVFAFSPYDYPSKRDYELEIVRELRERGCRFIALAGYMRLLGKTILGAFEGRIVNIHPSLLPAFPGLDAIGQAMSAGVGETGVTVHFVDAGMDTGPVIAQVPVTIEAEDTRADVQRKIQQVEHALYPKTIQTILTKLMKEVPAYE